MKANKKKKTQLDLLKEIRKPVPPPTRVERPDKGGGYKRRPKHKKNEDTED